MTFLYRNVYLDGGVGFVYLSKAKAARGRSCVVQRVYLGRETLAHDPRTHTFVVVWFEPV